MLLILTIIFALIAGAVGLVIAGPFGAAGFAAITAGLIQLIARLLQELKK